MPAPNPPTDHASTTEALAGIYHELRERGRRALRAKAAKSQPTADAGQEDDVDHSDAA